MSIEKTIELTIQKTIEQQLIPQKLEQVILSKYENRIISSNTAGDILDVKRQTIVSYCDRGLIPCLPREKGDTYRMKLSDVLAFRKPF